MNTQEAFWSSYYADIAKKGVPWLDYSNERSQAQIFGLALEAAGPVRERRCVDIGCGWGTFCQGLRVFQASSVTGIDIVAEVVAQHAREQPDIQWLCGSLHDADLADRLGSYDIAFLLEVLQYGPMAEALGPIWDRLLPGGRIVAVVPNANCPIVLQTRGRFGANYAPPTVHEIDALLRGLPELECFAYRGLSFAVDQRLVPYDVSPWRTSPAFESEPNRVQFVAVKQGAHRGLTGS
jgi:2-polyprenyl-3-methyl-5-hydroxy-6-metoxy-1,4-benzoquinol methylase